MKYLKLENAWMMLETGEKCDFGKNILSLYEFWFEKYNNYCNGIYELYESGKYSKEKVEEFKKQVGINDEEENVIHMFLSIMDVYLGEYKGEIHNNEFAPVVTEYTSMKTQCERQNQIIKRVKENGWIDIAKNTEVNLIDVYLLESCCMDKIQMKTTHHLYKNKWYQAYDVSTKEEEILLSLIDLQEIRNHNYSFGRCKHCKVVFIQKDGRNKYCNKCSSNYKKIVDQKRKGTPRGLHQKIGTYLRNHSRFDDNDLQDFLFESDYYWYKLKGTEQRNNNAFKEDIKTEKDYVCWLEQKQKSLKEEAKRRKQESKK